jgi:hypothetical protein
MLTRKHLLEVMQASEAAEERIYRETTTALFRELQEPLKILYDQAVQATSHFLSITPEIIQANPRIIKILRYCLSPVISQMRLGQMIGLGTTEVFEEQGRSPDSEQAQVLARWFCANLDRERFPWLEGPVAWSKGERAVAEQYARLWTVSLVSNQNTATKYRNQRKDRQEKAIANALETIGLRFQPRLAPAPAGQKRPASGGVHFRSDVPPRSFVKEKKILAGSEKKQKSDLTVRPTEAEQLFCIEAKAVGIRIDSTKRLKELNDKFTDWAKTSLPITTVGVVAGFFNDLELIATIKKRGIPIFFEHDLSPLTTFLQTGQYFGSPWNPGELFPDVVSADVEAAMEKIATTSAGAAESPPDEPTAEGTE